MYRFYNKMLVLKEYMDMKKHQGVYVADIDEELSEMLDTLIVRLENLESPPGFGYLEPDDLESIAKERPDGPRRISTFMDKELYHNKILGAWLGRSVGCALGIPVEGWSRNMAQEWAKKIGQYPLRSYWKDIPHASAHYNGTVRDFLDDEICCMEPDDDLAYTVLNLHIMEEYGAEVTTEDIAKEWLDHLPIACTAERVALENLQNGITADKAGRISNPFGEWIGASIRADIWGYVYPGLPELAARIAYRDARLSHYRNGIYGEMFFAAVISSAFVEQDIERVISIGLSEIPSNCRLSQAINDCIMWCRKYDFDHVRVFSKIDEKYGSYSGAHSINNAAICVMSLLCTHSFCEAIGTAVLCGWDTDCNAATVGSIWGAMHGASEIPEHWVEPLNDVLKTYVTGFEECSFTDMANRTVEQGLRILKKYS